MTIKRLIIIIVLIITSISLFTFLHLNQNYSFKNSKLIPKPGSCLILQEKYCKNGQLIKNPLDPSGFAVAFKVSDNTPLFSPFQGDYLTPNITSNINTKIELVKTSGVNFRQKNGDIITNYLCLFIVKDKDRIIGFKNIEKGLSVATISKEIINKNLGNYNLIVILSQYDQEKKEVLPTFDTLEKIFSIKN